MSHEHHYFYGEAICRADQQEIIQKIVAPFQREPATAETKKKVYDALAKAKHEGLVKIPFKVLLQTDPDNAYPPAIVVQLDTRV